MKKIIKIRAEINEIKTDKNQQRKKSRGEVNITTTRFLERISKIDKPHSDTDKDNRLKIQIELQTNTIK